MKTKRITAINLISSPQAIVGWLKELGAGKIIATKGKNKGQPVTVGRLNDGGGLHILYNTSTPEVMPAWWYEYTPTGARFPKRMRLGTHEAQLTLATAREAVKPHRDLVAAGKDPISERDSNKAQTVAQIAQAEADKAAIAAGKHPAGSYGELVLAIHADKRKPVVEGSKVTAWSEKHGKGFLQINRKYWATIMNKRLGAITRDDLEPVLDALTKTRNWETAKNALEFANQVFVEANRIRRCENNPAGLLVACKYLKVPKGAVQNHPQLQTIMEVGELVRKLEATFAAGLVDGAKVGVRYKAIAACGELFELHSFQRPENTGEMRWEHIDQVTHQWKIPMHEMKGEADDKLRVFPFHIVPLNEAQIDLLVRIAKLNPKIEGKAESFVFRTKSNKAMGTNTLIKALRREGYTEEQLTSHGLRGTAQTMIHNHLSGDDGLIVMKPFTEAHMCHAPDGDLADTYDKATYLKARTLMVEQWGAVLKKAKERGFEADEQAARAKRAATGKTLEQRLAEAVQPANSNVIPMTVDRAA